MTRYWLMKSEPDVFSIDDLKAKERSLWDGVRNYLARNYMKEMKIGDQVIFYHSNAEPSAAAGLAEVTGLAVPDPSQFDKKSDYYDAKASPQTPRWFCVEVGFRKKFADTVPINSIKKEKSLQKMLLLQNSRLSVQPVTQQEFEKICSMGGI